MCTASAGPLLSRWVPRSSSARRAQSRPRSARPGARGRRHSGRLLRSVSAQEPSRSPGDTTRWLVRFGYDGVAFNGWARQPGRRTVEGAIRSGVVRLGIATSAESARIDVASRTDAGVSARGNVLTVTSPLAGPALLRALNGTAEDIFFDAARPIDDRFRVRSATHRTYRYYLPGDEARASRLREGALLLGSNVDARTFGRGLPVDRASLRPIESIRVHAAARGIWIEVRAPSFVWGMVRKLVGGLLEWERGALSTEKLRAAARGEERLSLPLAPPDALILWEVGHSPPWEFRFDRARRHQRQHRTESMRRADARIHVLEALGAPHPVPPATNRDRDDDPSPSGP